MFFDTTLTVYQRERDNDEPLGKMFPTFLIVNDESVTREYHWDLQATQMGVSGQGTRCPQLPFQK